MFTDDALRAWDTEGKETTRIDGRDNLLVGRLYTNSLGKPGIILFSTTTTGQPGIWFSENGTADSSHPAIYVDDSWSLNVRAKSGPYGRGQMRMHGSIELVGGGILTNNSYGMFTDGMITPRDYKAGVRWACGGSVATGC